ncbi:cytochrome P450 [Clavulina sp. PMI_390]|nr:cytochrome P450 [Clavulina sp. PMI_390]
MSKLSNLLRLPESWPSPLIAPILLFAVVYVILSKLVAGKKHLPPGPFGIPWVGEAFKIPALHSYLYYTKLGAAYGDVYTVTALGQRIVVLNSYTAAFEVLGKRGSIHCDRPPNPFLTRFLGLEHMVALVNYGPDWKEGRRLYQTLLNKEVARTNYAEDVGTQIHRFILRVIGLGVDKDNVIVDTMVHKVVLQSTYGVTTEENDAILVAAIHSTNVASAGLTPGKHLVNTFPILQHLPAWIPFQSWRIEERKSRKWMDRVTNIPWHHMLDAEANGIAAESFALGLFREQNPTNEHLTKVTGVTNLFAGVEPMMGVSRLFLLAMILHPDVQKKAQEELDRVVGHDRLPTIDDQASLPYLDAIVKEVIRWRPVAPLSVPTAPTKDDTYKGYLIPQDAIVVQNSWAISRDEKMYPDADSFKPERWLVPNPPKDPRFWHFGIGRRVCPGAAYAEIVYATLFMKLLATVDIVHARDENGNEIFVDPSIPTTGRFACIPETFSYSLKPRSDVAVSLLREALVA